VHWQRVVGSLVVLAGVEHCESISDTMAKEISPRIFLCGGFVLLVAENKSCTLF